MFFAKRTMQRIRIALAVCLAYAVLITIVATELPREGKSFVSSFIWWFSAIPICCVAYVALEASGTWSLGLSFWQRMSSYTRILLLVTIITVITVGYLVVSLYIRGNSAL